MGVSQTLRNKQMINKIVRYFALAILLLSTFVPNFAQAASSPLGTNIKTSDGTVYTISTENSTTVRRPYTSAGAFLSYSFNKWSNVVDATADDLNLMVGSLIPPRDGSIVCSDRGADKGTCYLITEAKKAGFTSEEVFKGLGYSFGFAAYGDVSFLNSTPHINDASEGHRAGNLINKDGTLYLNTPSGLKPVPDKATLESWGYWAEDALPANAKDRDITKTSNLQKRQYGEIAPYEVELHNSPQSYYSISTSSLPAGTVGASYNTTIKFTYRTKGTNYATNATFSNLPTGIGTGSSSGPNTVMGLLVDSSGNSSVSISGIPTIAGTYKVYLTLTDQHGAYIAKSFDLKINASNSSTLSITNSSMPDGAVGADYSYQFKAMGGTAPYTFSIPRITHPCCYVGIMPTTGVFGNSGSSLKPLAGNWYVTVQVQDATGTKVEKSFPWKVVSSTLEITTTQMTSGVSNAKYEFQFKASGGKGPYTWDNYYTTHPCCYVGIMPTTGVFASFGGMPPLEGSWDIGISVTDSLGVKVQKIFQWSVVGMK